VLGVNKSTTRFFIVIKVAEGFCYYQSVKACFDVSEHDVKLFCGVTEDLGLSEFNVALLLDKRG
jgi:hypothetical protein